VQLLITQIEISTILGGDGAVEAAKAQATVAAGNSSHSLSKFDKKRKHDIDLLFSRWIVKKCRAVSIGHDEELKDVFNAATGGRYAPPCAPTVQKLICELSASCTQELLEDIKGLTDDGVMPSISADIWGENGKSIYGCLLHFIDKNFVLREKAVLAEPFSDVSHTWEEIEKCTKQALAQLGVGTYNPQEKVDTVAEEVRSLLMLTYVFHALHEFPLSSEEVTDISVAFRYIAPPLIKAAT
jgi:hypothetical protein